MGACNSSNWKEENWCKIGVQVEEECKRRGREIQSKIGCERLYTQWQGIDYDEVFAPVAYLETILLLISLSTQNQLRILQIDVKSTFFNGYLKEELYVKQL